MLLQKWAALFVTNIGAWVLLFRGATGLVAEETRPLLRDFIGLNGHTVQFKPELYQPACRLVRD